MWTISKAKRAARGLGVMSQKMRKAVRKTPSTDRCGPSQKGGACCLTTWTYFLFCVFFWGCYHEVGRPPACWNTEHWNYIQEKKMALLLNLKQNEVSCSDLVMSTVRIRYEISDLVILEHVILYFSPTCPNLLILLGLLTLRQIVWAKLISLLHTNSWMLQVNMPNTAQKF